VIAENTHQHFGCHHFLGLHTERIITAVTIRLGRQVETRRQQTQRAPHTAGGVFRVRALHAIDGQKVEFFATGARPQIVALCHLQEVKENGKTEATNKFIGLKKQLSANIV